MYTVFLSFHGIERRLEVNALSRNSAVQLARKMRPGYKITGVIKQA